MTATLTCPNEPLAASFGPANAPSGLANEEKHCRRLRVLHVINGEHYAGAERVQDLLGQHLPAWGIDAAFACLKLGRFAEVRESTGVPLWNVPMRNRLDLRVAWQIAKIIRSERFDMVHAHTVRSAVAARLAAAMTRIPFVYHVHSPTLRDTTSRLRNWCNATSEGFCLRGARHLICVSQSLRNYMLDRGYDATMVSVVPNGVPTIEPFAPKSIPSDIWTIGTVALVRPRKGIETLLDAAALLRSAGLPIQLRIVGPFESNDYERSLRQRVEQLRIANIVEWVGFTRQVPTELKKMDLFVLPSLFGEGMPMVVLEAMTAGVPIVASDVEGIPEAIRNEIDGLIVPPNDAVKLARGISRIVRGEVSFTELRQHARQRHFERFSAEAMAAGVANVYRRILPN